MKIKSLTFAVSILMILSCKKEVRSSADLDGQWKFVEHDDVTIAGLHRYPADPANPQSITFLGNDFTQIKANTTIKSGKYRIARGYHADYYSGDAILVDEQIFGTFKITQGNPDTLYIDGPYMGIDANSGDVYVRTK